MVVIFRQNFRVVFLGNRILSFVENQGGEVLCVNLPTIPDLFPRFSLFTLINLRAWRFVSFAQKAYNIVFTKRSRIRNCLNPLSLLFFSLSDDIFHFLFFLLIKYLEHSISSYLILVNLPSLFFFYKVTK